MILAVWMVSVRRLRHNRIELILTFLVPIAFFSIFALIFGSGGASASRIKVAVVDPLRTPHSQAVVKSLLESEGLRVVHNGPDVDRDRSPAAERSMTQRQAIAMVRRGTASIAIVLRSDRGALGADLLSDSSDQVGPQIASALVQRALLANVAMREPGIPTMRLASDRASRGPSAATLPVVRIVDVLGANKNNPVVSMYAAGIAVMFLLFGATGGGGALLEERESQTLDRLLTTGLSMDDLLLGKWCYLTTLGVLQTTVMFLWGYAVFGIDLLKHLDGFLIMTVVTAGAAAAFGLLLATLCRTRGQLNGLSVIVVLTMSALGGSMVPRYVMSPSLREAGLWTFNAWALDGYDKVFWRELPVIDLWPQMSVLMLCGAGFLFAARLLAVRWETD